MPIRPLNSVAGFSVGETPSNVVDANLNFTGNTANFTGNLVSANANLGNLARANFFQGDGSLLTNLPVGTSLSNGTSNVSIPAVNGNVNISSAGNANILVVTGTGVNVAGTLNASGNANVGNIGATRGVFTNISGEGGNISNIQGANVSGTVTSATNASALLQNTSSATTVYPTFTTSGSNGNSQAVFNTSISANLGNASITATTFVGNLSGIVANGTSNLNIPAVNGNVNISAAGNANILVVTGTGVNVAGTLNATGNANVGNIGATRGVFTNISGEGGNISNIQGANVSGAVTSATNAAALLQNTSTATTVYPTFTTSSANGNSQAVFNTGISANLGNSSITATTFVGALSGAATTAGTVTTAAQPNITSVGTLTSLAVTGNVTAGNVYANSGTIGASLLTGTLTTAAQPNITSVGTLTSLSVTGNVAAGNLTTTGVLSVTGTGVSSIAGNLDMTSNNIINLATPVNDNDAATKAYVDSIAQGLHVHQPVAAATPNTLEIITGGTITYNNGTAGVGANLVVAGGTYTTIDSVNIATVGTRILVKNQANAAHNGIYTYSNSTVLIRATDFDTPTEMGGGDFFFCTGGTLYNDTGWVLTDPVTTVGTTNVIFAQFSGAGTYTAGTGLTLTGTEFSITNTAVTPATYGNGDRVASFTVNQQGQLTAASNVVITANAANLTGTTLAATIVNSSLTSVGTLGSLAVTGNVTAGNLLGRLANGNSNVNIPAANGNVNISAVGNANILVITGTGVNVAGTLQVTGVSNLGPNGNVIITGGSSGQFLQTNGSGVLTWASVPTGTGISNGTSNVNIPASGGNVNTSVGGTANVLVVTSTGVNVAGTLNATGNANVGNLGTAQVLATANVTAPQLISNVTTGTAPFVVTSTTTVANLSAATAVSATNAAALLQNTSTATTVYPTFTTSSANGNSQAVFNTGISANLGNSSITATTFVGNVSGNVTGNITGILANGTSNVNIPAVNGNVNISSAGNANILVVTGTGVNVAGTLNATGNANVGNLGVAFVGATANVTAPVLISNVATGTAPLTVTSTTRVANLNVAYANVADLQNITSVSTGTFFLTLANAATGNVQESSNASLTFNAATGNLISTLLTGTLTTASQPNITSVGTLTSLAVTGNVTAGNVYANSGTIGANIVNANNNIGLGNTAVRWAQVTTTAITANQTISTLSATGITGVEWLVRGVDSGGGKFSVASVIAVTNGTTVDYSIFGTVNIGTTTGTLAVNINGGNIELQVTPSSTSSTVWVTQYRTI